MPGFETCSKFERAAHHLASLEEHKREQSHALTEREVELREEFDQSWAAMLAVHCTPVRWARSRGWGMRPEVERERVLETRVEGEAATVTIHTETRRSWDDTHARVSARPA